MNLIYDGFLLMVGAVLAYAALHVLGWLLFFILAILFDD